MNEKEKIKQLEDDIIDMLKMIGKERQAKKELVEALEITNKFLNNINGHVKDNVMDSYLSKLTLDNDKLLNKYIEKE